jgi:uncharacterized protein YeaC (DUF1315 family)
MLSQSELACAISRLTRAERDELIKQLSILEQLPHNRSLEHASVVRGQMCDSTGEDLSFDINLHEIGCKQIQKGA